ncbi:MAG TPA: hypothetical protein VJT50_02445 [Pyrinomonadaceae bacterium]|jgi:hypothetical protein|nr:hypothetical protein [Pyrinomonadaceae bacterium]
MFEKFPTPRMNNSENSPTERLIAAALELGGKPALHDASGDFPSYLRLFGTFFELLTIEPLRGAARLLPRCYGRFCAAQAHVAFL